MNTHHATRLQRLPVASTAIAMSVTLLLACGDRSEATHDSAAGTVAMTDSTGLTTSTGDAASMDAGVAATVATVNQGEVEAARLATTKAKNSDVKDFARDMVEDHEKALADLQSLGSKNSWMLPDSTGTMTGGGTGSGTGTMAATITQLQQSHQTTMTTLRNATGAAFDRAYMDAQVAAHQQALDLLRQHAATISNAELRDKVTAMQKEVEDHLKRAQTLAQRLGGSAP